MKFRIETDINAPLKKVVTLFENEDNLKEWMDGLQSIEQIEGIWGKEGSRAKMIFNTGKQKIELVETILVNNLPNEFTCRYETKGMVNIVKNSFEKITEHSTKYLTENEFELKGVMKIMTLFPFLFKKQSMKYLSDFKKFVERLT